MASSTEELWCIFTDLETTMYKLGFDLYDVTYMEMYTYIDQYGSLKEVYDRE